MKDKATQNAVGDPKIGVTVSAYSLADPTAEPKTQHYSFGSKAHKSIMVYPGTGPNDPMAGMGFCPIAGAPPAQMFIDTAWNVFVKEFVNAGLPEDLAEGNDLSVIDGVWVTLGPVPEPESWKNMAALGNTGEGESSKMREPGTIAVPVVILPGGAPWEGGGGLPKTAVSVNKAAVAKPVAHVPAAAVAVTPETPAGDSDDLMTAAREAIVTVLSIPENAGGMPKVTLRMAVISTIEANYGADAATAIVSSILDVPATLATLLGEQGYKLAGLRVTPA